LSSERGTGPGPRLLRPQIEVWPAGARILRCHHAAYGATEYNPGLGAGRFHPFASLSDPAGAVVPTLYGSADLDGALSGTAFHNVPIRGAGRAARRTTLRPLLLSVIAPRRDLRLVQLHGQGLRRLDVSREELIACEADRYPETLRWAAALHATAERPDGMIWVSRQHDTSRSLVLFGDRVARDDLAVVEAPVPLYLGIGFERVQQTAEEAEIVILQ
jgi:hypothetical protein